MFCNAPGTSPVSSPIFSRSIISCGNSPLRASGCAMVLPSVTASRVWAMASLSTVLGTISSVIFSAVSTGTPLMSSVESVRANWPKRFRRITLPSTGAFIFQRSIFCLPLGVTFQRSQSMKSVPPTASMMIQFVRLPKNVLMFISNCVAHGSSTFKPWKMVMNFGSMKVMKKMMITTPTLATMAG